MHRGCTRLFLRVKKAKKEKIANEKHMRRDESFAKPAPLALLAIRTPLKLDVADCMFIVLFFLVVARVNKSNDSKERRESRFFSQRESQRERFFSSRFSLFFRFFFPYRKTRRESRCVLSLDLNPQREHALHVRKKKKNDFPSRRRRRRRREEEKRARLSLSSLSVFYISAPKREQIDKQRERFLCVKLLFFEIKRFSA